MRARWPGWLALLPMVAMASSAGSLHGKVAAVSSRPSSISGDAPAWVQITVEVDHGSADLFVLHDDAARTYPKAGQVCSFDVHIGDVGGTVGGVAIPARSGVLIADRFACD